MKEEINPETLREIRKWILQSILGLIGYGLILFLSAGTTGWIWGWVLFLLVAAFLVAHPLILIPINPELLAEREKGLLDPRVNAWDRWIAFLGAGIFPVVSWIIAGLDVRFRWTSFLPISIHLAGLLGNLLGYGLFLWAMASNAFFTEGVQIQVERGHTVVKSGPYHYVRHPGYIGSILAQLATPFLLGSYWALIPSIASVGMYGARTYLEDNLLKEELPGYQEYSRITRYRLLPGVW